MAVPVSSSVLLDLGFKGTLRSRLQGPGSRRPVLGGTGKRCKCLLPRPQCRRVSTSLPRTAGVLGRKARLPDACGFAFSVPAGLCSAGVSSAGRLISQVPAGLPSQFLQASAQRWLPPPRLPSCPVSLPSEASLPLGPSTLYFFVYFLSPAPARV